MKRIFFFTVVSLYIACNADSFGRSCIVAKTDYVTIAQSQQAWNAIASDSGTKFDRHGNNFTYTVYVPSPVTFSTQHRHFRHHSSTPHYDLNHMSTKQLAWYFSTHGYIEGEILSHPMLYMNSAYLTIAKQLPRYPEFVEKYYKKYRTYKGLYKFWETIHFRYRKGMRKQFARLHWECEEYRKTQGSRHSAAQQTNISTIEPRGIVNTNTIRFAREYGITEQQLALMHNDTYAQRLHREFLDQLSEAQAISAYYAIQPKNILIDTVSHGIAIGMEANSLHQRDTAVAWARFGRKVLEIIEGVGEGIVLFAENNVYMIRHPVHTLKQVVHTLGQVAGMCARTIGTVAHWHELMECGKDLVMAQEMDDVANQIITCGALCAEKLATMPTRDIAKHTTAIAADILLTHRMFTLCGNLCTQAAPVVRDTITAINNRIPHINDALVHAYNAARTESPMLQTAEGMLLKTSEDVSKFGGTVIEIITDARLTLENIHAEYMINLKAELEMLRLACDNKVKGAAELANKWLKIEYEHILGMELSFSRRGVLKIGGFHHDFKQAIEKSHLFEFTEKIVHEAGFYKAKLYFNGDPVKEITFFPSEWPRQKVIEKIYEAYNNFVKSGVPLELQNDGKYLARGIIDGNVKIEMYITAKGKIVTAYPKI